MNGDAQCVCMTDASLAEAKSLASQALSWIGLLAILESIGYCNEAVADQTCIVHTQCLDVKNGLQDDIMCGAAGWRCLGRGTPSLPSHA